MASPSTLRLRFSDIPESNRRVMTFFRTEISNTIYSSDSNYLYRFRFEFDGTLNVTRKLFPLNTDRVHHVFQINENEDLIIWKNVNGFGFYINDENFSKDSHVKNKEIAFGHFYDDFNRMGAVAVQEMDEVDFYEIIEGQNGYTFQRIETNSDELKTFCPNIKKVTAIRLKKIPKVMLMSRNSDGLCIFEFDLETKIRFVTKIPVDEEDKIFFPNLCGHETWMDMVTLNSSGMYVHAYQEGASTFYRPIGYNPMFSEAKGWTGEHSRTVSFEDIDNDGCDEAIFTGPFGIEILSYSQFKDQWTPLLTTMSLAPKDRNSKVLHVVPRVNDPVVKGILFTSDSDMIRWAKIVESPADELEFLPINEKFYYSPKISPVSPSVRCDDSKDPLSTLYLRDRNIWFEKTESVNPGTGKPNFVIPLVGEPGSKVKFHLFYNERNKANEPLGVGWSSQQSFIAVNFNDGNFEEDESYVMVVENVAYKLKWLRGNSTDRLLVFDLEDSEDRPQNVEFKADFYRRESIWKISFGTGLKQVYGKSKNNGGTLQDAAWKNWRGTGFDQSEVYVRDNTWYLASEEYGGAAYHYEYAIVRKPAPWNKSSYNSAAFLRRIYDKNTEITFSYSSNHTEEGLRVALNENSTVYLKSYTYRTRTKEQIVFLRHAMIGDSVILTSMDQKFDYVPHPVVEFQYKKFSKTGFIIEKIFLPTRAEIIYEYKSLGTFIPFDKKPARRITVSDDYLVSYGPGFTLVSYVDKTLKQVFLRMFNYEMTEEIYPIPGNKRWEAIGQLHQVQSHEILLGDSFLAVVVYSSPLKTACLFGRNKDGSWRVSPNCFDCNEDAIVLGGPNFVLVSDSIAKVRVMEWSDEDWNIPLESLNPGNMVSVAVYKNKFVMYNDHRITLGYKTSEQEWTFKTLADEPGYLSETENTLNKFDLKPEFGKAIKAIFRNNAIQMKENLIVLSSLSIHNDQEFRTKIKTYIVGRDHEISVVNETFVQQDVFSELSSEKETDSDGDRFTLKYSFVNGKFNITLNTFDSNSEDERNEYARKIVHEMNSPAKRFLLDMKNYFVSLRGSTVHCRNVQYSFGGNIWHRFEMEKNATLSDSASIFIGNRFIVNKTDAASNVKLIDAASKQIIKDLGVKDLRETQINYPVYIAAQGKGKPLTVLELNEDSEAGFTTVTLAKSQKLSPFGNAISMVTHEMDAQGKTTLFIYPMYGVRRVLPNWVVSSQKLVLPILGGGSTERVTGYEYDESSVQLIGDQIRYSTMSVLPGNSKTSFGYFKITEKSTDFFNNQNKLVKTVPHKDKDDNEQDRADDSRSQRKETTIFDVSGRYEIASYAPFNSTSGMAGYVGFEDYEETNDNWVFDRSNVVRNRFALTGRNYLNLDGASLQATFRPLFQQRAFIASCWIRIPIEDFPTLGDIVPHLRLAILTAEHNQVLNVLSDVKLQLGDWFYLEVFVDLEFVHLTLNAANPFESSPLQVKIWISPLQNIPIDVNNVRFSSIDSIFSLNVYDDELEKRVAVIKPNGAILRYIYDENKVQIAEVNESNQIKGFNTYTKGSYNTASVKNPACLVTLVPGRGFYENFSPFSFRNQWSLTGTDNWSISPGSLYHHTSRAGRLFLNSNEISQDSYGVRFLYFLKSNSFVTMLKVVILERFNNQIYIYLDGNKKSKQAIPAEGEILLLKDGERVIVWINGRIYIDEHSEPSKSICFVVKGDVRFSQLMVFSRPQVTVAYKNALNEDTQQLTPTANDVVIITEKLYDELGRQRINVQPVEVIRSPKESLLSYSDYFVINKNPKASDSVWRSRKLKGKINDFIGHPFGFSEVVYDDNPLNIKIRVGRPGELFVADGVYAIHYNSTCLNPFVLSQYPQSQNYTYEVQILTPGSEKVDVFDKNNLKVASLTHVEGAKDILATFKYNDKEKLIESLPPVYYEKVGIFNGTGLVGISKKTPFRPQQFATIIEYDDRGNARSKLTPDSGLLVNIHDEQNRLRFTIQYSQNEPKDVESTTYFLYDDSGRITNTGKLKSKFPIDSLLELKLSEENSEEFQQFFYSYSERDPAFRGKLQRSISRTQNGLLFEESIYDTDYNVISKRYITPNGSDRPQILSFNKQFRGGLLKEILYPASMFGVPFRIAYEYDRLGRMTSVGVPGQADLFLTMTYNAKNQVESETISPASNHSLHRTFTYNEAGFLTEIADSLLTEKISYTEGSYTDSGYGDGRVARVKFIAKWLNSASSEGIGVHEDDFQNSYFNSQESRKCYRELKRRGYLNAENRQTRVLYGDLDEKLSLACTKDVREPRVKQILGKNGFPEEYGFRFDYGDHVTLRYAKYFVRNEVHAFKSDTFAKEIPGVSDDMSKNIWKALKSRGYLVENDWAFGEPGRVIVRESLSNFESFYPEFEEYAPLLNKLLMSRFRNHNSDNSREYIDNVISQWFEESEPNLARNISEAFFQNNYHKYQLDTSFISTLQNYGNYLRPIVGVMQEYFTRNARSEFDMKTIEVDANGNRRQFYTGFEDYQLEYEPNSNRISEIRYKNSVEKGNGKVFEMRHDSRGNVIKAMHKGIRSILYHPVSNRVQTVYMEDGKIINYSYDAKGERVQKQLTATDGTKISVTDYFRDETGRTLLQRKQAYIAENQAPDILVTIYIYGANSLVGFMRRGQFYSVISDHQGSVRLIVRDGEVVAAYDYMPYGNLMRIYGNNPDAHIDHRYTGQEWDEDIGLYNYHARLYDPSIGRFYQIDPVLQSQSPYSYVYNSPVSLVDPSGKLPHLIIFAAVAGFGILGAYLYTAYANKEYNPMKWDLSKRDTQLALAVGFISGAMLPIGFTSSMAALAALSIFKAATIILSLGVTVAYISAAAANSEWNPLKWDYTSPKTWSALFEGFSAGVGIIGSFRAAAIIYNSLTGWKRYALAASVFSYGLQSMYEGGRQTNWDLKKPEFWLATGTSIFSAPDFPMFVVSSAKFIRRHGKDLIKHIRTFDNKIFQQFQFQRIGDKSLVETTRKLNALFGEAIRTGGKLILGSATFTFLLYTIGNLMYERFQNWDLTQLSVYHNLLTASHLTGKFFETYEFVRENIRMKNRIRKRRIADAILHSGSSLASAVTDIKLRDWRAVIVSRKGRHITENAVFQNNSDLAFGRICSNILLIYTSNRYTNPLFVIVNNATINNLPSSYNKNIFLPRNIIDCIGSVQNEIEIDNRQKFCQTFSLGWDSANPTLGKFFHPRDHPECENAIESLYADKEHSISQDYLISTIEQLQIPTEQSNLLKQKYAQVQEELSKLLLDFSKKLTSDFHTKNIILAKIKYLIIVSETLKHNQHISIVSNANKIGNILWNKIQNYSDSLTRWESVNCAEPPLYLMPTKQKDAQIKYIANPNAYDHTQNLDYLSSYKLEDLPVLSIFDKCYNCINVTSSVRNIVRDIEWLTLLNSYLYEDIPISDSETNKRSRRAAIEDNKICENRNKRNWTKNLIQKSRNLWFVELVKNKFTSTTKRIPSEDPQQTPSDIPEDILEFGTHFVSQLANNGTLLLFEALLAKYKKRQIYRSHTNRNRSTFPNQEYFACEVIEMYEELLKDSAKTVGLDVDQLEMTNNFELYGKIIQLFAKNEFEKIITLLRESAVRTLSVSGEFARQTVENVILNSNFISKFDQLLKEQLLGMK